MVMAGGGFLSMVLNKQLYKGDIVWSLTGSPAILLDILSCKKIVKDYSEWEKILGIL